MHVAAPRFVEVIPAGLCDVGDGGGHRHLNAEHLGVRAAGSTTETDQHTGCAGTHQMQGSLVGGATADDHRHVQFIDEPGQIEWLDRVRDVLRADRGPADHEEVQSGVLDHPGELLGVLRTQRSSNGHSRVPDLAQSLGDEFSLDGFGIDLLQPARLGRLTGIAQFFQQRFRVGITGPEPFQVEHTQAAQFPESYRGGRAHHRIHRRRQHREIEGDGVDAPVDVNSFDAAGTPGRHDRHVIQRE